MGKNNMGIFYGKKYNPRNRTFSLENGENFIEGTGHGWVSNPIMDSFCTPTPWLTLLLVLVKSRGMGIF